MTESSSNGKSNVQPDTEYRHLGADVWAKRSGDSLDEDIAYTEELLEELAEDGESEASSDN